MWLSVWPLGSLLVPEKKFKMTAQCDKTFMIVIYTSRCIVPKGLLGQKSLGCCISMQGFKFKG